MRILFALVATVVASIGVAAQVPDYQNGCARCGITSFIDYPASNASADSGAIYLAGWGFECESGRAADRVDVFYRGNDGNFVPAGGAGTHGNGALYWGIGRPDVQNAFRQHCPSVTANVGWHFYFTTPLPAGARELAINVWYGPYRQTHYRTVTIR